MRLPDDKGNRQVVDLLIGDPSEKAESDCGERQRLSAGAQPLGDLRTHAGWMYRPARDRMVTVRSGDRHFDFGVVVLVVSHQVREDVPARSRDADLGRVWRQRRVVRVSARTLRIGGCLNYIESAADRRARVRTLPGRDIADVVLKIAALAIEEVRVPSETPSQTDPSVSSP